MTPAWPWNSFFNHPLDQFEIFHVLFYWTGIIMPVGVASITNLTVFLFFNVFIIRGFFAYVFNRGNFNGWELVLREIYNLVKSIVKSNTSLKRNQYFSVLFYLFIFVVVSNLVGLIPYSFTSTSSFVITFFLSLTCFIGANIIGVYAKRWYIANLGLPNGVPLLIAPFLILIELVSYVAKVFSLSIRLFANMMSGHALLKILIGFSWGLMNAGPLYIVVALLPWIIVTAIMFLETLIAFLQSYVFTILVTIYINDVLVEH